MVTALRDLARGKFIAEAGTDIAMPRLYGRAPRGMGGGDPAGAGDSDRIGCPGMVQTLQLCLTVIRKLHLGR
jgi:hypothetical protein